MTDTKKKKKKKEAPVKDPQISDKYMKESTNPEKKMEKPDAGL